MITNTDLLNMPPEAVYAMVMNGDVRLEEFCQWFDSQTRNSQIDGYASGWQDGRSDGYDAGHAAGHAAGYDSGYEDGASDSAPNMSKALAILLAMMNWKLTKPRAW